MAPEFEGKLASPKEVRQRLRKPWNQIPGVNLKEAKAVIEFINSGTYHGIDCELLNVKEKAVSGRRRFAAFTGVSVALTLQGAFLGLTPIFPFALGGICVLGSGGSLVTNWIADRLMHEQTRKTFRK